MGRGGAEVCTWGRAAAKTALYCCEKCPAAVGTTGMEPEQRTFKQLLSIFSRLLLRLLLLLFVHAEAMDVDGHAGPSSSQKAASKGACGVPRHLRQL